MENVGLRKIIQGNRAEYKFSWPTWTIALDHTFLIKNMFAIKYIKRKKKKLRMDLPAHYFIGLKSETQQLVLYCLAMVQDLSPGDEWLLSINRIHSSEK